MKKLLHTTTIRKYWLQCTIFSLILVGTLIRFYKLGEVPVSLYWDEIAMLVDAKSIAETGKDMHGDPGIQPMFFSYGDFKLPTYIVFSTISVWLFGTSEWSLRLPSAVFGTAQILLLFFLAQELWWWSTRKRASLFLQKLWMVSSALIVTISPWSVMFSRNGFEGHLGQFFVSLSVLFLLKAQRSMWLYPFSALLGAISVYSYYSVRFVWPVIFVAIVVLSYLPDGIKVLSPFWTQKNWSDFLRQIIRKSMIKKLLVIVFSLVLWGVLLTPLYTSVHYQPSQAMRLSAKSILNVFDLPMQSNMYREWAGNGPLSRVFYHRHFLLLRELLGNYAENVRFEFLFMTGDQNLRHGTGQHGLFVFSLLPVLIFGLLTLARSHWRVLAVLTLWWIIALLPASVPEEVPHALRSLNALTPLVLMIGFGLAVMLHKLFIQKNAMYQKIFIGMILFTVGLQTGLFLHDYFGHYPQRSAQYWQSGYSELARFIHEEKDSYPSIIADVNDGRFYLWLMIYGDYTGEDYQSFEYVDNGLGHLDQVKFRTMQWQNLQNLPKPTMVIATPGNLQVVPSKRMEIFDSVGNLRFEIGIYESMPTESDGEMTNKRAQ